MHLTATDYQSLDGTQSSRLVLDVLAAHCRTFDELADDNDGGLWNLNGPACDRLGGPRRAEQRIVAEIRRQMTTMVPDQRDQWGVYEHEDGRLYVYWGSERVYA